MVHALNQPPRAADRGMTRVIVHNTLHPHPVEHFFAKRRMRPEGGAEHTCAATCTRGPWFETRGRKGGRAPHHEGSFLAGSRVRLA